MTQPSVRSKETARKQKVVLGMPCPGIGERKQRKEVTDGSSHTHHGNHPHWLDFDSKYLIDVCEVIGATMFSFDTPAVAAERAKGNRSVLDSQMQCLGSIPVVDTVKGMHKLIALLPIVAWVEEVKLKGTRWRNVAHDDAGLLVLYARAVDAFKTSQSCPGDFDGVIGGRNE